MSTVASYVFPAVLGAIGVLWVILFLYVMATLILGRRVDRWLDRVTCNWRWWS